MLYGGECESVWHVSWECPASSSIRADFLRECIGDSVSYFEAMNSSDKAFGSELWEEHFESLLALVKEYIIEMWEERKTIR